MKTFTLKTKKWRLELKPKNGHVHVKIAGNGVNRFRKQVLTSICDDLNVFQTKVVAYHLFYLVRAGKVNSLSHVNHAEVFGSCFE